VVEWWKRKDPSKVVKHLRGQLEVTESMGESRRGNRRGRVGSNFFLNTSLKKKKEEGSKKKILGRAAVGERETQYKSLLRVVTKQENCLGREHRGKADMERCSLKMRTRRRREVEGREGEKHSSRPFHTLRRGPKGKS